MGVGIWFAAGVRRATVPAPGRPHFRSTPMASAAQAVRAQDLQGFKYFQLLQPLLARLHDHATARDKAGNRRLHFDQYAALVLFYFFNPILTSLKGLQQASDLAQVQKALGCA